MCIRDSTRTAQQRLAVRFAAAHPLVATTQVPALPEDVHDLEGLRTIGDLLTGSE